MKKVNSKNNVKRDIVIIGGGPAGLSLACSLADTSLKITIIEKQSVKYLSSPSYDGREIALTHFSKKYWKILEYGNTFLPAPYHPLRKQGIRWKFFLCLAF